MSYAELIETLESLPVERRGEVFDFAEFLAARYRVSAQELAPDTLAELLDHPRVVGDDFVVMKREDRYDR